MRGYIANNIVHVHAHYITVRIIIIIPCKLTAYAVESHIRLASCHQPYFSSECGGIDTFPVEFSYTRVMMGLSWRGV